MFDTWVWRMIVNFSYVISAIVITLLLAKAMAVLETAILSGNQKGVRNSLILMAVCSLGVGFAVASFFGTFLSFPNVIIKVLIILSMGVIIFTSAKRYIENSCRSARGSLKAKKGR